MKKILIALALLVSVQVVNAQVKSVDAVKKAVETAEADAQNPGKETAFWLEGGPGWSGKDTVLTLCGRDWPRAPSWTVALFMHC